MYTAPGPLLRLMIGPVLATGALLLAPGGVISTSSGQNSAPELEPNLGWLNTDKPLRFSDELKGHVVVLDFWTYCCINCMHILPDLEYLEEKYKAEPFVVIGVHSAKFTNEGDRQSIRNAIFRYHVRHPVVIDKGMSNWNKFGAHGWPYFVVIDSRGVPIVETGGEGKRDKLDAAVKKALDEGRQNGTLAAKKSAIKLDAAVASAGGLAFPGKVIASADYLFIADSSHNRVVVATYPNNLGMCSMVKVFGDAPAGSGPSLADGDVATARFHDPQGMAFDEHSKTLYVADTKNHAVRAIDLASGTVRTLAGDGTQGHDARGGLAGAAQRLNSPWDLVLAPDFESLYVAMAGQHQIWQLDIATGTAKALAGSGKEDIADGPAPVAALAQTSGLAISSDNSLLYFADSETSSIRALDLGAKTVSTILGTGLFEFGDIDGAYAAARLQHPLGVTVYPTPKGDCLMVADTYNHRIRMVDPRARKITSWLGVGRAKAEPKVLRLDEPGGIFYSHRTGQREQVFVADTNNHRVVMIDPETNNWREVVVSGLEDAGGSGDIPAGAIPITVGAATGRSFALTLSADLPAGAHPNTEAPMSLRIATIDGAKAAVTVAQRTIRTDKFPVRIDIPGESVKPGAQVLVELSYAYCTEGQSSLCVPAETYWRITIAEGAEYGIDLKAPVR